MNKQSLKLYIFCCSTSIDTEELMKNTARFNGDNVKIISLPCSGKVDILYLVKAFETGADGAVVVTCKPGECRYLEGNLRAKKRVEAVDGLLDEIGLGRGRLAVVSLDNEGTEKIYREVKDFIENLQNLLS